MVSIRPSTKRFGHMPLSDRLLRLSVVMLVAGRADESSGSYSELSVCRSSADERLQRVDVGAYGPERGDRVRLRRGCIQHVVQLRARFCRQYAAALGSSTRCAAKPDEADGTLLIAHPRLRRYLMCV